MFDRLIEPQRRDWNIPLQVLEIISEYIHPNLGLSRPKQRCIRKCLSKPHMNGLRETLISQNLLGFKVHTPTTTTHNQHWRIYDIYCIHNFAQRNFSLLHMCKTLSHWWPSKVSTYQNHGMSQAINSPPREVDVKIYIYIYICIDLCMYLHTYIELYIYITTYVLYTRL